MRNLESRYDVPGNAAAAVLRGKHREYIGGMWDEIGLRQKSFMVNAGLKPESALLDIGCGCLRGGVHFVKYLNPGCYYGTDLNSELLEVGYNSEICDLGLQEKLPRKNLIRDGDFEFPILSVKFDFAIAVSVFTHISFNRIRTCLEKLHPKMKSGGSFFASYFGVRGDRSVFEPQKHEKGGVVTFGDRDPYHYRIADFKHAAEGLPWEVTRIGDWDHPRDQLMVCFRKAA